MFAKLQSCDQWLKYKFGGPGTIEMMGPSVPKVGPLQGSVGPDNFVSKDSQLMQDQNVQK